MSRSAWWLVLAVCACDADPEEDVAPVDAGSAECPAAGRSRGCGVGVGRCEQGTQVCGDDGRWSACVYERRPADETCNGGDDDCDGTVDEALTRACGREVGACRAGVETCVDGDWGECAGAVTATDEVCDAVDQDCDGAVDEGVRRACGSSVGVCAPGLERCVDGGWSACDAAPREGERLERCDGLEDEDCDGQVDEGCPCEVGASVECGSDVGRCRPGIQHCVGEAWTECEGAIEPADERCNDADDDCDGELDEGATNACGGCGPVPDEACNGADDDCDGLTDEGVTNACGMCGALPPEACNEVDDDCDGATDEGVANACGACGEVPAEACNAEDDDCDGAIDEGVTNACGACGEVPAELCNGDDDDCDGRTDEEVAGAGEPCAEVEGQCERQGQLVCLGAEAQVVCDAPPPVVRLERCNGDDDDCDGVIDEAVSAHGPTFAVSDHGSIFALRVPARRGDRLVSAWHESNRVLPNNRPAGWRLLGLDGRPLGEVHHVDAGGHFRARFHRRRDPRRLPASVDPIPPRRRQPELDPRPG